MALNSQTVGLTYNIPNLSLVSLSLNDVSKTLLIRSGVVGGNDFDKIYSNLLLYYLTWAKKGNGT